MALSPVEHESREQTLERLFTEHAPALRRFVRARVVGSMDVEDLVQEVYYRLLRMDALAKKLPPGKRSTRSFLLTVANRLIIDRERHHAIRRKNAERLQLMQDSEACSPSPECIALAMDDLQAVSSAIEELKPQWRQAFVLNRFKHMSYHDVAKTMNVSIKTVEKYIGRALLHLRLTLSRD